MKKPISIRIDERLIRELEHQAAIERRSRNNMIEIILEDWFKHLRDRD